MKNMSLTEAVMHLSKQRLFYVGKLMSPKEVALAIQDYSESEKNQIEGWHLCGELHPKMWEIANSQHATIRGQLLVLKPTPEHPITYAIFLQVIGHWQHRMVLPLLGQTVGKFLESLQTSPLGISLGDDESNRTIVVPLNAAPHAATDMHDCWQPNIEDPLGKLEAATLMAVHLTNPECLIPLNGARIDQACVTLILPPELRTMVQVPSQREHH